MVVELFGYQNVNKGQEMMFHACREFLETEGLDGAVSITSGSSKVHASYKVRKRYGLKHLVHIHGDRYPRTSFLINKTGLLLPARFKKALNLVTREDVDVVFDFSGFQYSDQWGSLATRLMSRSVQSFKSGKKKFIILPQSFGPFENISNRKNIQIIVDGADLIFAREETSYNYLISECGNKDAIRIAPDFTNLVESIEISQPEIPEGSVFFIPNMRMLDKTDEKCRSAYLPFLAKCVKYTRGKGLLPVILLHETLEDISVANRLISALGFQIPIITHEDPRILKGFIKRAFLLIGSRYHALISGLSQSVPTIATGWTHKYGELMKYYGCQASLVSPLDPDDTVFAKIDAHIEGSGRTEIVRRLNASADKHAAASHRMWAR